MDDNCAVNGQEQEILENGFVGHHVSDEETDEEYEEASWDKLTLSEENSLISNETFWPEETFRSSSSAVTDQGRTENYQHLASEETGEESVQFLKSLIEPDGVLTRIPQMSGRMQLFCDILKDHPLGVQKYALLGYFKNSFGTVEAVLAEIVEKLVTESGGLILKQNINGLGELYFLANASKTMDLRRILSIVAKCLETIVAEAGNMLPVRSVLERFSEEYKLQLDPLNWNLNDQASLVKFIFQVSPNGRVHVHPFQGYDGTDLEEWMFLYDEEDKRVTRILGEVVRNSLQNDSEEKSIHQIDYLQFGERLDCMSIFPSEGLVLQCNVFQMYSIIDFYVLLVDYWNQMESFQACLQKRCEGVSEYGEMPPRLSSSQLVPGMYAVCYLEEEWKRVEIVSCVSCESARRRYKIRELEFGVTATVSAEDLRLLDKNYFKSMPAHAIHCRLRLPEPFNSRLDGVFVPGSSESSKSAVILNELVKEKTCFVTLRSHLQINGSDSYIWEVDVSLGERESEFAKVAVLDVAECVLKKLAKAPLFERIFT